MPIDRNDHRPGKCEERTHEAGQQGEKAPYVLRASLRDPEEIHSCREDGTRSRQDEGTDIVGDSVEFALEGVEQFDIDRAHLSVRKAEGENAFLLREFDHLRGLHCI
jgi:hypothetical protein